jgi:hypothetical protein
VVQLLSQRRQIRVVMVLDEGSAHYSLKELSLQDDLGRTMHVIGLNTQLLNHLPIVMLRLLLVLLAKIFVIIN